MLGLHFAAYRGLCTARRSPSCKNHTTVSAVESAAARAFAKSAWQLTFTSAFLPLICDTERTHVGLCLCNV